MYIYGTVYAYHAQILRDVAKKGASRDNAPTMLVESCFHFYGNPLAWNNHMLYLSSFEVTH